MNIAVWITNHKIFPVYNLIIRILWVISALKGEGKSKTLIREFITCFQS